MTVTDTTTSATTADFTLADLTGRWHSTSAAEVFPGIWGVDDFWMQTPFWGIHFSAYSDPHATVRLFELFTMGTYELLGPSGAVPGARDADFSRVKVAVALHAPDLAASAGAEPRQWRDVSFGGCAPIDVPGIDVCTLELDLLGLARSGAADGSGDVLYFGQRHHDEAGSICDRRAPGLLPYGVERVVDAPRAIGAETLFGPAEWTRLTSSLTPVPGGRPTSETENPR